MLRNLLASGASALVGFGLVGALPSWNAVRDGQDGKAKTEKTETTTTTLFLAADDTESLLRQAYDRIRRVKAERLEGRQKALVEDAAELYRQAIKAHEAEDADLARAQALAALELIRAVEQARAAREVARPDPSLPPPPASPVAPVPPVPPVPPLPPLPPPIGVTVGHAPSISTTVRAVDGLGRIADRRYAKGTQVAGKPDGKAQVIEFQIDDPSVSVAVEGKPVTVEADSIVVHRAEGKPMAIQGEPAKALTEVFTLAGKAQDAAKNQNFSIAFTQRDGNPAEARAQVQKAYEAVKKARDARKDSENHGLLDTARDLYNSARAAAEAGENAKAIGLAQAAISLTSVPSVDVKNIQQKTVWVLKEAQNEAKQAQAQLEKHRAELAARVQQLQKDQATKTENLTLSEIESKLLQEEGAKAVVRARDELKKRQDELAELSKKLGEVQDDPQQEQRRAEIVRERGVKAGQVARAHARTQALEHRALTIAQGQQAKALARVVEGKPLQAHLQSITAGPIEVRVVTKTEDADGKAETTLQVHVFKDGQEVPADQVKLEKKGDSYILRLDAKEAKKVKEQAKPATVVPGILIEKFQKKVAEEAKPAEDESIVGIGVSIREDDGKLFVQEMIAGGPAQKDGRLKTDDQIVGVEDKDGKVVEFVGKSMAEAVELIRGPEGSQVKLIVTPAGSTERKTYELSRARIVVPGTELPPKIQD